MTRKNHFGGEAQVQIDY